MKAKLFVLCILLFSTLSLLFISTGCNQSIVDQDTVTETVSEISSTHNEPNTNTEQSTTKMPDVVEEQSTTVQEQVNVESTTTTAPQVVDESSSLKSKTVTLTEDESITILNLVKETTVTADWEVPGDFASSIESFPVILHWIPLTGAKIIIDSSYTDWDWINSDNYSAGAMHDVIAFYKLGDDGIYHSFSGAMIAIEIFSSEEIGVFLSPAMFSSYTDGTIEEFENADIFSFGDSRVFFAFTEAFD